MARPQAAQPGTLGHVLYGGGGKFLVSERDWLALVRRVAARDQAALHALYERAHRPVFTLLLRKRGDRRRAEELTLAVFHDVWRSAADYDPAGPTVLGWIMNFAQALAAAQSERLPGPREHARALLGALHFLTADERKTIEAAWFQHRQPGPLAQALIHSGLHKLRQALAGVPRPWAVALNPDRCAHSDLLAAHALQALAPDAAQAASAHIASCASCRMQRDTLVPVIDALAYWPADVLRPSPALHQRLAGRISILAGTPTVAQPPSGWREPEWDEVAPGIEVKMLAIDAQKERVSMLVRLLPDTDYPPHTHAGVEELHLLDGELWIDDRKVLPGDYNRALPGTGDKRVWSKTGCTCVLMTSTRDILA